MEATQALVLIVGDDEPIRGSRARLLQELGFRTLEADNGRHAIELTQLHEPELILMNVAMPVMNGLTATQILKGNPETHHIPIILFAENTERDQVTECLEAGADECMNVAVNDEELIAKTNVLTAHKRDVNRVHQINEKLSDKIEEQTDRLELLYDLARELSTHDNLSQTVHATVHAAAKATGSKCVSIMLHDASNDSLYIAGSIGLDPAIQENASIPVGEGISGTVFAENAMMVVENENDLRTVSRHYETDAFVSLPVLSTALAAETGPVGVLNVTEKSDGQPFTKEQIHCLQSIADNAAVAIQNRIRREELDRARDATIFALAKLTEYRDQDTGMHIERVQHYCRILAEDLAQHGLYRETITQVFIDDLVRSACLHDIGKIAIPDSILLKPGRLTVDEFDVIKTHTVVGSETLVEVMGGMNSHPFLRMAVEIVRSHHEKFDGTGYPDGLAGTQIPLPARILALADVYDALTNERPYKKAAGHDVAADIILRGDGAHFDPEIVSAFKRQDDRFNEIRVEMADAPSTTAV